MTKNIETVYSVNKRKKNTYFYQKKNKIVSGKYGRDFQTNTVAWIGDYFNLVL